MEFSSWNSINWFKLSHLNNNHVIIITFITQNEKKKTVQLADAVKRGAHSLGSSQSESQVMVINAVKDVASALGELINTTKNASGKPVNDPYMQELKESAKVSEPFRYFSIPNICQTVLFRFYSLEIVVPFQIRM